MAIHTAEDIEPPAPFWVIRRLALAGQDRLVTLERLDSLLESIAGWEPQLV